MNYYNPYFYTIPSSFSAPKVGLFARLLGGKGLTFGTILNGTQRALNFANQAIPLVKQVRPLVGNAKTMFRVMNEFKKVEKPVTKTNTTTNNTSSNTDNNTVNNNTINNRENIVETDSNINYENGPTFFI